MKKLLFFVALYICTFAVNAQPLAGRNTLKQMIETADAQFEAKAWSVALEWYNKAKEIGRAHV